MNSTPPQLITYVDRLAGTVTGVRDMLETRLSGMFGGIHLLPYFTPFDGADAGFDRATTPASTRDWARDDVRALSGEAVVASDVIVNHVSAESDAFQDVRRRGDASPFAPMFLTLDAVFLDARARTTSPGSTARGPACPSR
jgi:sucrose phosphorylase